MDLATVFVLVAGIIAIVFGIKSNEWSGSTFWFLLSFWLAFVLPGVAPLIR